jgi:hypothetical protein
MKKSRFRSTIQIALLGLAGVIGGAGLSAVPRKQALGHYTELWSNSPFTIPPVVGAPEQVAVNPFEDYTLAGVCELKGGWFVVLINKKTRDERIIIKPNEQNDKGFKIVSVNQGAKSRETKVEISQGGKTDWVEYDEKFLAVRQAVPANGPGQANRGPRVPPIPGQPGTPPIPGRPSQTPPPNGAGQAAPAPAAGAATPPPGRGAPAAAGVRPTGNRPSNGGSPGNRSSGGRPSGDRERSSGGRPSGGRGR